IWATVKTPADRVGVAKVIPRKALVDHGNFGTGFMILWADVPSTHHRHPGRLKKARPNLAQVGRVPFGPSPRLNHLVLVRVWGPPRHSDAALSAAPIQKALAREAG